MLRDEALRLVLLGAPGAGKGTQAEKISQKYNIPTISTGNIIRESLKNETPLGLKAKSYIDSGALVPDEIIISIVKERLSKDDCKCGFILDGVPRTIGQAKSIDEMGIDINKVISIEVADDKIISRLSGRRVCSKCGSSYHITDKPSKQESVCDNCGEKLIIRHDDDPKIISDRLKVYHEQTEPLKDYYKSKGLLIVVEGQELVEETTRLVDEALNK